MQMQVRALPREGHKGRWRAKRFFSDAPVVLDVLEQEQDPQPFALTRIGQATLRQLQADPFLAVSVAGWPPSDAIVGDGAGELARLREQLAALEKHVNEERASSQRLIAEKDAEIARLRQHGGQQAKQNGNGPR